MANHGFLHIPTAITIQDLDNDIRQIVKERFNDGLSVETHRDCGDYMAAWVIKRPGHEYPYHLEIYMTIPTLVETTHPINDWMFWVSVFIFNKLGAKYSGLLSDEGTGHETWQPDPAKYPTYKEWLRRKFLPTLPFRAAARLIYALTPPELKAFDKIPYKR